MAKICILLTFAHWAERRLFHRQAPALAEDGHEVIYMAVEPDTTATDKFQFYPLSVRQRKIARLTGSLNLLIDILKVAPDVLEVVCVEQLPLALVLKLFTRIKVTYDCREDMYHSMLTKVWFPMWLRRILACCTLILQFLADRILDGLITSDPAIFHMHKAMPESRKIVFYNVALLARFRKDYLSLAERPYDVVLMGSMAQRTGLFVLTEALRILANQSRAIKTLLIGRPSKEVAKILEETLGELKLTDKVTITGVRLHAEIPGILKTAKIGLVLLLDTPKFRNNIACKAFEYMACGMPVVSSDLPPERLFIREPETGIFFKPGDADALAKAIAFLLDNIQQAQAMGEAGRKDVELKWNCENEQKKLCKFYRRILTDKKRKRQK
jgi:glycosyltransferase involved in cell wall biosynthesis